MLSIIAQNEFQNRVYSFRLGCSFLIGSVNEYLQSKFPTWINTRSTSKHSHFTISFVPPRRIHGEQLISNGYESPKYDHASRFSGAGRRSINTIQSDAGGLWFIDTVAGIWGRFRKGWDWASLNNETHILTKNRLFRMEVSMFFPNQKNPLALLELLARRIPLWGRTVGIAASAQDCHNVLLTGNCFKF